MTESVADALARVTERIAAAAERAGRDRADVKLVAVTKGVPIDLVRSAAEAGIEDFGENRAKELRAKADMIPSVRWHFLGSIQTNKVKDLVGMHLLHGMDRLREAEALQTHGGIDWDVLVQVNIASEPAKQGIAPRELPGFLEGLGAYPRVRPRGLMFVAPHVKNAEDVRTMFGQARALRERYAGFGLTELSMGMSNDYEVAVEEGSTIVRLGRSLFAGAMQTRPEDA